MVDPYQANLAAKVKFTQKRVVKGRFVVVLEGTIENRGIELIHPGSRCVRQGEIFELICTDEQTARPAGRVDRATYLGFCEVVQPGVLRVGDRVEIHGQAIGRVAGFDETHFPNHQNVVIKTDSDKTPPSVSYGLEDEIAFVQDSQS